jgi:hypothetical protein
MMEQKEHLLFLGCCKAKMFERFFFLREHLRCGNGIHVEGYVV